MLALNRKIMELGAREREQEKEMEREEKIVIE